VSPQNVLISEQGEVKLTDFGIAKAMGRRERTNQGVIKGKLAFMSPEQASGWVLDNRSDLFALGTMLYQFFTERRPFEAPTDLESITRVRECKFTPPEMVKPGLHPALVKIIRRAMQALPANRYQSADEMLVDIENVQRTAYKPAGQTELKRWLAELQQRDHCQTISHASAAPAATAENEGLDVGEGAEVVFDESNVIDIEDVLRGMQPTIAAAAQPPPVPKPVPPAPKAVPPVPKATSEGKTKADAPIPPKRSRIPSRTIAFALLLAALALGAWLALPGSSQAPMKRGHESPAKRTVLANGEGSKPGAAPLVGIDAGTKTIADAAKPATPAPAAPAASESEEEEENLLKNAEPDDYERVIDESEGVKGIKKKSAKTPSEPSAEPVSVRLVSTPEGAVIRLGKRVFGRAPMNLRFRPGITFELTFVKKGYLPATKRFIATGKKNQTVKVALTKKHVPRKSLFRRIFGGR
jgi:serine/threonine-protein kinase